LEDLVQKLSQLGSDDTSATNQITDALLRQYALIEPTQSIRKSDQPLRTSKRQALKAAALTGSDSEETEEEGEVPLIQGKGKGKKETASKKPVIDPSEDSAVDPSETEGSQDVESSEKRSKYVHDASGRRGKKGISKPKKSSKQNLTEVVAAAEIQKDTDRTEGEPDITSDIAITEEDPSTQVEKEGVTELAASKSSAGEKGDKGKTRVDPNIVDAAATGVDLLVESFDDYLTGKQPAILKQPSRPKSYWFQKKKEGSDKASDDKDGSSKDQPSSRPDSPSDPSK